MEDRVLLASVTNTADSGPGSLRQAIADTNASPVDNIINFNITAGAISEITLPLTGSGPRSIRTGSDNSLWFTEFSGNRIGRITPAGVITEFPIPTLGSAPAGIAAGPDDSLWFTQILGNSIGRITPAGVITEFPIPTPGGAPDEIAAGSDGSLWFTGLRSNTIGRITTAGVITEFALPRFDSGPDGIAAGPDGALWFAELRGNAIGRITTTGEITEFPLPTPGGAPTGITVGPDGNLWFTQTATDQVGRIGRITTAGVITEFALPTPGSDPNDIVAGPDGSLWFTQTTSNRIGRITTAGVITEFALPTPGSQPFGIAAGPDGSLWFTELTGNRIGRINVAAGLTITPQSALPAITDPVTIDGTSQPGVAGTPIVELNGAGAGAGASGLVVATGGGGSTIRGLVINRFTAAGVTLIGGGNLVVGNYIGTDVTGNVDLGNGTDGVVAVGGSSDVAASDANTIGGVTADARNVISGNTTSGISLFSSNNLVQGNLIGTNAAGLLPVGNGPIGVLIAGSAFDASGSTSGNTVGGVADGARNVISGNGFGVRIQPVLGTTSGHAIQGNFIGTDITGNAPLGNTVEGLFVGSDANTIGGVAAGAGNVISGNASNGLAIIGLNNLVLGNFIGLNVAGNARLGNGGEGITLPNANAVPTVGANTIGGTATGARNVISGNRNNGIAIGTSGNLVQGNSIGTDGAGNPGLGNGLDGVAVFDLGVGNAILSNAIASNGLLGIDLGGGGAVRVNVTGGPNAGANRGQNYPVITSAITATNATVIAGTLNSNPNTTFLIQLFASDLPDPSGFGQGQTPLVTSTGPLTVTTDAFGNASFTATLPASVAGRYITATATSDVNDTSEFSRAVVAGPLIAIGDATVAEGNAGPTLASFAVTLSGPSRLPITVAYATADGTATAASGDYVPTSGVLTFAPGQTTATIVVVVNGDRSFEQDETFSVVLSAPTNATIGVGVGRGVIVNDDPESTVVTNTNDAGEGSLRAAILVANRRPGLDAITFAIPGDGVHTIRPLTPLPALSDRVAVDGNSQAAFAGVATATPLIEVDGRSIGGPTPGLRFLGGASSSLVAGLSIFGFRGAQVDLASDLNAVQGNYLGLRANGMIPGTGGTLVESADPTEIGLLVGGVGNVIGGLGPGQGNVISGNAGYGIDIRADVSGRTAASHTLLGNRVGVDPSGSVARGNGIHGILIEAGVSQVTIGVGNVVSGNGLNGIELIGASGIVIDGAFVGTDATGTRKIGNAVVGICIDLGSTSITVGSLDPASPTVVSGNGLVGIAIRDGSRFNRIANARIGTDATGTVALGNGSTGILVLASPDNRIGPGNVISGNGSDRKGAGVWIEGLGSSGNVVRGNLVGTDASGARRLGNAVVGVLINDAPRNTVGGLPLPGDPARNVISGNGQAGVMISGPDASDNVLQGNLIGTDASGTSALGNGEVVDGDAVGDGVYINGAPNNIVGGVIEGARNVISGNRADGVLIFDVGATGNLVQGNFIGTDVTGTLPLGNRRDGVVILDASLNTIDRNVISANRRNGLIISGRKATDNVVTANAIGLSASGTPLGNGTFGVLITDGSRGNTIAADNQIAGNATNGVRNTTASPSAPPLVGKKKAAKAKAAKTQATRVKVQPRAQSFGGRALQGKKAGKARARLKS